MEMALESRIQDVISTRVPVSYEQVKIGDIQDYLEEKAPEFNIMDYVYILDDYGILKGVISLKKVLSSARSLKAKEVMHPHPITISPEEEVENVVYLSLSHSLKSLPVTGPDKKFVGVVAHHDILKFFNQEVESDIFKFGGIFHKVGEEYTTISSSAQHMIRSRLPWLIIGVMGGIMAASVISLFEDLLSSFIALASFIPVMVYMSDAAGTQSEALIIRSLALDPNLSFKTYLIREIKVGLVLALVSGGLAGIMALITRQNIILGLIIFLSMFLSIMASVIIATWAPLLFKKINFDPAVATGPLATIISDLVTLSIYLGVALLLLSSTTI